MSSADEERPASRLVRVARTVPLGAAIVAPLITLLDIPALTQRWYLFDGKPTPDPAASIAMSAVSLVACVLGNALLIIRFSSNVPSVKALVVEAPLVAFWIKTLVEVINLGMYGHRGGVGSLYFYSQGFWTAVFSCGLSGLVALLLSFHWVVQRDKEWKDSIKVRIDGRHFMLSVTAFVLVIALMALVFSRIEGWTYVTGLFFAIVSTLTVGFGQDVPTKTSTRILLFPFLIIAIALLANQISMIIGYFGRQSELRRNKYRAQRLLLARQGRMADEATKWGLAEEMDFLTRMQDREHKASQLFDLVVSLSSFIVFWLVGAAVFQRSEPGWSYGDSLYFIGVMSLTVGYGDLYPSTPFSQVFFIFYALVAVPVVASAAVSTITTIVERASEAKLTAAREKRQKHVEGGSGQFEHSDAGQDEFHSHARFVFDNWAQLGLEADDQAQRSAERRREDQTALADEAVDLACQLESLSRSVMIGTLEKGSKAQILLQSDRNVQRRDVKAAGVHGDELVPLWEKEDAIVGQSSEEELLHSIRRYRETFARFLTISAKLKRLEGANRLAFLRIREEERVNDDDSNLTRAEREVQMMNEADGAIEVRTGDGQMLEVDVQGKGG